MHQIGKLITCDRCGEKIFMERVECKPNGTETFTDEDKIIAEWGCFGDLKCNLCPACTEAYRKVMKDFMNNGRRRATCYDD